MSRDGHVAFAVFFICCVIQTALLHRVRWLLRNRHPQMFEAVAEHPLFPLMTTRRFIRDGRYKDLSDRQLARTVRVYKLAGLIGTAAWLGFAIAFFSQQQLRKW